LPGFARARGPAIRRERPEKSKKLFRPPAKHLRRFRPAVCPGLRARRHDIAGKGEEMIDDI